MIGIFYRSSFFTVTLPRLTSISLYKILFEFLVLIVSRRIFRIGKRLIDETHVEGRKRRYMFQMDNSAYVPNHLPPPSLVVFSQAGGLPEALRMQRPFNPQVSVPLSLPLRLSFRISSHLYLQLHCILFACNQTALKRDLIFSNIDFDFLILENSYILVRKCDYVRMNVIIESHIISILTGCIY